MKKARWWAAVLLLFAAAIVVFAEGTQLWQQSRADEFEKGTGHGVSIKSDGELQLAPDSKVLATTSSTYIWALASDSHGVAYIAAGSPARVYRVDASGKSETIFESKELQAQAIVVTPNDDVLVATAPEGKIYKLSMSAAVPATNATTASPAKWTSSTLFDPKTKYIWALALAKTGDLFAATGDTGTIFKIDPTGKGTVFFKSDEPHIRSLAFDSKGNLIAGSDGNGLVYRISPKGEAFVLYSAAKKEITALAVDGNDNIYAASVGEKHAATAAPPQPPVANAQPANPNAQAQAAANTGSGSEVDMISADGTPSHLWTSREDIAYALAFNAGGDLLIGTGNKGQIYSVAPNAAPGEFTTLMKSSANQVTAFAPAAQGALYAATSNLGKLALISAKAPAEGSFESDVFDAKTFSKWGRVEVHGSGKYDIYLRSGNVDNPDRNWSNWVKVDLNASAPPDLPSSRFVQWRAMLYPGTRIDSVGVNYLPKNIAPVVDDVAVTLVPKTPPVANVPQSLPVARDLQVRWNAHDENDDQLVFSIYFRGVKEQRWQLLRDGVRERQLTVDPSLFPDGEYQVRVVASDLPSHPPEDALTGERVSASFEIDSTPPAIDALQAVPESGNLHISFRANDSYSPLKRAEYSIDAGAWQLIEPVGGLSDARTETYDFTASANNPTDESQTPTSVAQSGRRRGKRTVVAAPNNAVPEHLVTVRVFDRFDNMATAKVIVPGGTPANAQR